MRRIRLVLRRKSATEIVAQATQDLHGHPGGVPGSGSDQSGMSQRLVCDKCNDFIEKDSIGGYRLTVRPLEHSAHPGVDVDWCPKCSDALWGLLA